MSEDADKPVDWLKASQDHRKALYRVMRGVEQTAGITIDQQLSAALGQDQSMGIGYRDNLRQGKIARTKAKLIYGWLSAHHGDLAHKLSPELFPEPPPEPAALDTATLEAHLAGHAITGKLRIVKLTRERGIVERAREAIQPDQTLKLGEEFCFEFDGDRDGTALMFQVYQGEWHPLPLGADGKTAHAEIKKGMHLLPLDAKGQPIPLVERYDIGLHRFVLVVAEREAQALETNGAVLTALTSARWYLNGCLIA